MGDLVDLDDAVAQRMKRDLDEAERRVKADMRHRGFPDVGPRYFNRQGEPITMGDWGVLHRQVDYVVLRKTYIRRLSDVEVSTVWLGLDHGFSAITGSGGPPIIFETMIFGGPLNNEMERYATEEAALEGHERTVERVRRMSRWRELGMELRHIVREEWENAARVYPYDTRGDTWRELARWSERGTVRGAS